MQRKDLDKERQNWKTLVLQGILVGSIGLCRMVMFFEKGLGLDKGMLENLVWVEDRQKKNRKGREEELENQVGET